MCNAAAIERGERFYMYEDMTPAIARLIEVLDAERRAIGAACGLHLRSAADWIAYAYRDIAGDDLCSRMRNNPAYARILAPTSLHTRMLFEDIPAGLVPMTEFARLARIATPGLHGLIALADALLGDALQHGRRTLAQMGVTAASVKELLRAL
jgi:opine dehydrogenase